MPDPSQFRHYQIVQDSDGNNVELVRNAEQVAVLAFDTRRLEFVHCHVLLEPLANRAHFDDAGTKLQKAGHPLLASLIDFGEDEGNPFYITSNIDGETLRAYLGRQQELPGWLAVMIATRALESMAAVSERGEILPPQPLDSFRILQTGPQSVHVLAADFQLISTAAHKAASLKPTFEKQAKFLKNFLTEQSGGGPTLPDHSLPAADFTELLNGCLSSGGPSATSAIRGLRAALQKLVPESVSGEIPTAQKPRSILAPLLASYQEVARGMVNLVRIQSQRLDMTNPYSMRGTLTKTGRQVMVEQVPPSRLCTPAVEALDHAVLKLAKKSQFSSLVSLALVNESEGITCLAEEVAEGVSLADLLRERRSLDLHESYLLLAGLDSALSQVEAAEVGARKIRLEDIYLLTGFPREDARSSKILTSKLNEWPAFSIMVRAHPTLASLSGRGTDPAVLLGLSSEAFEKTDSSSLWHGGWLAALSQFLLAFQGIPGVTQPEPHVGIRERETVGRLLEDELSKSRDGHPSKRSDFLARYARVIHHHDLVKPAPAYAAAPLDSPASSSVKGTRPLPVAKENPAPVRLPEASRPPGQTSPLSALTSGLPSTAPERPSIGFAEALFTGTSQPSDASGFDWVKTAVDAPPTLRDALLPPRDYVPFWLKASVFIGGSMITGALFAHFSGDALWQKSTQSKLPPHVTAPVTSLPNKAGVSAPEPAPAPAAPAVSLPTLAPDVPSSQKAPSLLKPPANTTREILGGEAPKSPQ